MLLHSSPNTRYESDLNDWIRRCRPTTKLLSSAVSIMSETAYNIASCLYCWYGLHGDDVLWVVKSNVESRFNKAKFHHFGDTPFGTLISSTAQMFTGLSSQELTTYRDSTGFQKWKSWCSEYGEVKDSDELLKVAYWNGILPSNYKKECVAVSYFRNLTESDRVKAGDEYLWIEEGLCNPGLHDAVWKPFRDEDFGKSPHWTGEYECRRPIKSFEDLY